VIKSRGLTPITMILNFRCEVIGVLSGHKKPVVCLWRLFPRFDNVARCNTANETSVMIEMSVLRITAKCPLSPAKQPIGTGSSADVRRRLG
jgi:hypothetical protein